MSIFRPNQAVLEKHAKEYMRIFEISCRNISFFSKFLLRPMEITLSDEKQGLFQVVRTSITTDKVNALRPIEHPDLNKNYQDITSPQKSIILNPFSPQKPTRQSIQDGNSLLHLYTASPERHIKVAICICVYSEQQEMLKRTLSGINANYLKFLEAGVTPEEIAVVFIFDGIQKISKSIESFFDNMDEQSNFKWKTYGKTLADMAGEEDDGEIDQDYINIYSKEELDELKRSLFPEQRKEYFRNLQLLDKVKKLKSIKGLAYEDLPTEVQNEYIEALTREYQNLFDFLGRGEEKPRAETLLQFFQPMQFDRVRQKCVAVALTEVQELTNRYFASRKDSALLYSYRYDLCDFLVEGNNFKSKEMENLKKLKPYVFMCVKYTNAGKLSSQNWFFRGFCHQFKCDVAILLDVGLKPDKEALFKFYKHLSDNQNVGGVCGYMGLAIERPFNDLGYYEHQKDLDCLTKFSDIFFDIQKAQRFEYHFAHMLDKPFESFFGFINVLPGAFSGYNMKQLFKNHKILEDYFDSLNTKKQEEIDFNLDSIWTLLFSIFFPRNWIMKLQKKDPGKKTPYQTMKYKNVCLAEDRILCLGIHQKGMIMSFLPDAWATVDSVVDLEHLMAQRRRWINGSYFAFQQVTDKADICTRNIGFAIQMSYYLCNALLTYISVALFYITLDMTANAFARDVVIPFLYKVYSVQSDYQLSRNRFLGFNALSVTLGLPHMVSFFYVMMVGSMVFLSLNLNQTNRPFQRIYNQICSLMGWYSILMYLMLASSFFMYDQVLDLPETALVSSKTLKLIIYGILGIQAIPPIFFVLFVKRDFKYLWEVITSAPSYIFYAATYIHVLNIFAVCRIDDLSWGTKGLTSSQVVGQKTKLKQAWETEKFIFVSRFIMINIIFAIALKILILTPKTKYGVILVFSALVGLSLIFRLIFSMMYLIKYKCCSILSKTVKVQNNANYIEDYYNKHEKLLIEEAVLSKREYIENELRNPTTDWMVSIIKKREKPLHRKRYRRKTKSNKILAVIKQELSDDGSNRVVTANSRVGFNVKNEEDVIPASEDIMFPSQGNNTLTNNNNENNSPLLDPPDSERVRLEKPVVEDAIRQSQIQVNLQSPAVEAPAHPRRAPTRKKPKDFRKLKFDI